MVEPIYWTEKVNHQMNYWSKIARCYQCLEVMLFKSLLYAPILALKWTGTIDGIVPWIGNVMNLLEK
jgi:hypothetical protein